MPKRITKKGTADELKLGLKCYESHFSTVGWILVQSSSPHPFNIANCFASSFVKPPTHTSCWRAGPPASKASVKAAEEQETMTSSAWACVGELRLTRLAKPYAKLSKQKMGRGLVLGQRHLLPVSWRWWKPISWHPHLQGSSC